MRALLVSLLLMATPSVFAGQADLDSGGRRVVTTTRNVYSSTNVTTSAWVQLVAAMPGNVSRVEIFDSSGATLKIGFGAAGSEVTKFTIIPGGNGIIPVKIPIDTRVSIRAISGTASAGELDINYYE